MNSLKRQNDFISGQIRRASELAYVEGAQDASGLLACLHSFIRYLQQDAEWVPLSDEMKAVDDYIALCRLGDGARGLALPDTRSCFVRRMMLVDAVMQACPPDSRADAPRAEFDIRVEKESAMNIVDWDRTYFMTKYYVR